MFVEIVTDFGVPWGHTHRSNLSDFNQSVRSSDRWLQQHQAVRLHTALANKDENNRKGSIWKMMNAFQRSAACRTFSAELPEKTMRWHLTADCRAVVIKPAWTLKRRGCYQSGAVFGWDTQCLRREIGHQGVLLKFTVREIGSARQLFVFMFLTGLERH